MSSPKQVNAPNAPSSLDIFSPNLFKGKVVFATGGGSGIGKHVVETMMRHGVDAVIIGRKTDRLTQAANELEAATGRKCIPATADVRDPKSIQAAAKLAVDKLGRIDFVICGAAGNFLAPLSHLSENAFKTVMEIDTLGTFNTFKATIPYVRQTHGAYIHFSATLHYQGSVYQAHVSAAKAGVDALSNVIAIEEGPYGVRSNVIAPGPIGGTPGMDRLSSLDDPSARKIRIPLGRMGEKADIANAAVFLFSNGAAHVTGQILVVDGGAQHTYSGMGVFPYPESVLEFEKIKKLVPRL
ncbi:2,4-dienoyl-CoA reductase [Exidia glandulosa HHB12029]|uniref:2,4-dienoyl-CoA reductase [(3E)-enoyl-CoA-producing] n=1 Tax=Exidia glandulosa HHB12029 TaxID=1314781 RepID=A0A165PZR3_EXIGL|nr:2,4-dienoyl-CoA reductase [Exidia glandulosa HHB12029]